MTDFDQVLTIAYEHKLSALLSAVGLSIAAYVVYNAFLSPLRDVPGPLSARTGLGSYMARRAMMQDIGWKLQSLHDQHGTVVRIGRNTVSIADPAVIPEL